MRNSVILTRSKSGVWHREVSKGGTKVDLTDLAGVGKETAERFVELGIETPLDLLNDFPFRYDDLRMVTPAAEPGRP